MRADDPRVKALATVVMSMFRTPDERKNALTILVGEVEKESPLIADDVSWHSFMRELRKAAHVNQLQILKRVKAAGSFGVTLDDVAGGFDGCTRQGVGGMLSGVTKLCKRFGLNPERVIATRNDCYFSGEFLTNERGI